jgi:hypothetical protein
MHHWAWPFSTSCRRIPILQKASSLSLNVSRKVLIASCPRPGLGFSRSLFQTCVPSCTNKNTDAHTQTSRPQHTIVPISFFLKKSVIMMLRVCFVNICACIRVRELGRDYSEHFRRHRPVQKRKQGPFLRRKRCCEEPP